MTDSPIRFATILCLLLAITTDHTLAAAQEQTPSTRTLIVGTKEAPPFAMKSDADEWYGLSIELWRRIAEELGLAYEFRQSDLAGLLAGVGDGSLDAAVAALTISPEREAAFDFTHPFHTTGLGIATTAQPGNVWLTALQRFLSLDFLKAVAALGLVLLAVGALAWLFERKRNPAQFGGGAARGIGAGFWWSAVTMTTVGYGDKAPVTFGGRVVAVIWMFAAIIVISSFTAAITSALTVTQLETLVAGSQDLPRVRVGAIADTTGATFLRENRIGFQGYEKPADALRAAADGQIDAVVYDAPLLRYLVNQEFQDRLEVLPDTFVRQDYAIALPAGSPLREPINRALLEIIQSPQWQDTLYRYLGRTE